MPTFIDLTNEKFSRLTVIARAETDGRRTKWICRCDCGVTKTVAADHLRSGHTRSCGCLQADHPSNLIHGDGSKRCREYRAWCHMIGRCLNPTDAAYANYGGRGITVCEEWRSYPAFLGDMGRCPPGQTLGRIDNDLGYDRSNCRWENWHQQQRNRRNNHRITSRGRTATVAEWAEMRGISSFAILGRLRLGWSEDRAIWEPKHG